MRESAEVLAKDVADYVTTDKWANENHEMRSMTLVWYLSLFLLFPFMFGNSCGRVVEDMCNCDMMRAPFSCVLVVSTGFLTFYSFASLKIAKYIVREHEYSEIDKKLEEL